LVSFCLHLTLISNKELNEIIDRKDAKKFYIDALEESPTAPHGYIKRRANQLRAKRNIRLKLSKTQAKVLDREAILKDLDAVDLATKIVSDWIARRH